MTNTNNRLTVSIISGGIILLAFAIFGISLSTKSNVQIGTVAKSSLINDSIFIYRNQFGIPHIITSSQQEAFFALGYTQAQDRLWQMDFMRRIGRGQLAEIFGKRLVQSDKFFRILGIQRIAEKLYASSSKQTRQVLEAYSNGVNCFMKEHPDKLPFECGALSYVPTQWKPTDCLVIARLMAFDMSMSFWTDLSFGEIADTYSVKEAELFIPEYPSNAPTVCDVGVSYQNSQESDTVLHDPNDSQSISLNVPKNAGIQKKLLQKTYHSLLSNVAEIRTVLGMHGMQSGSNAWVMDKRYDHNSNQQVKGTILANDPHLTLGLPSRWYQAHITCPQFNVTGMTIPGTPSFMIGRNEYISWGITNIMLDDCDYFIEKVDKNPDYYYDTDGRKTKFRFYQDTIKVNAATDEVFYYRGTNRSAVISDAHPTRYKTETINYPIHNNPLTERYALTYSWTGREMSDEILTSIKFLSAKSWNDFTSALQTWNTPALNFMYTDKSSNMGVAPTGFIPKRLMGNPNLPHPGWERSYAWSGVYKNSFPRLYNPDRRYIASANNLTSRSIPFHISSLWEPPSRAIRINNLLKDYGNYTARDAQIMQIDITSPNAELVLSNTIKEIEKGYSALNESERQALYLLQKWNYTLSSEEASPAVYTMFHERLMHHVFTFRISEQLYSSYAFVGSLPVRKLNQILKDSSAQWFQKDSTVNTSDAKRLKHNVILSSFRDAVKLGHSKLGHTISEWKYGTLHKLHLKHPFTNEIAYKSLVDQTITTMSGDATTINSTMWKIHDPFEVAVGPSVRFVTDMSDTLVYSSLPGGSSGQPLDAHYYDQVQLWANGGYTQMSTRRKPTINFRLYSVIVPK